MVIPDKFYRLSVKALVLNEARNRFLVIQDIYGMLDFPGGSLEFGESCSDCLLREIGEEMGVEVEWIAEHPSYFFTDRMQSEEYKGIWYANVFFEVKLKNLDFKPSDECVSVQILASDEAIVLPHYNSVDHIARLFRPG